jgi:hemoglobin
MRNFVGGATTMRTTNVFNLLAAAALMAAVVFGGPAIAQDDSLYHDLGEHAGITQIVDNMMTHILADDRIKDKFADSNIPRLKGMLADYFTMVSGGPDQYKGNRDMRIVHKGLHLHNRDFTALVEDLQTGMDEAGIPFATQNRLLARLAPQRPNVVTR